MVKNNWGLKPMEEISHGSIQRMYLMNTQEKISSRAQQEHGDKTGKNKRQN
jgi:hypothetical protein